MLYNKQNLISMLSAYSTVYFKPTGGSGGKNIIRIKKRIEGYQTQFHSVKTSYSTLDRLYKKLTRFSKNKSFFTAERNSSGKNEWESIRYSCHGPENEQRVFGYAPPFSRK